MNFKSVYETLPLRWLRRATGPVFPVLSFFAISLVIVNIARLSLIAWQWPRVAAVEDSWLVLLLGLRMDLVLIAYLSVPLLLGAFLFPTPSQPQLWGRFQRAWISLWAGILIFMECATPSFINQYDHRPNRLFFEYLGHPQEVGLTLWAEYKYSLLLALVLVVIGTLFVNRLSSRALSLSHPWGWKKRALLFPLFAGLVFIAARGSFDHRPANPSTAAFATDHLINELGLNSTYSALFALYRLRDEKDSTKFYPQMAEQEIIHRVKRLTGAPSGSFTNPKIPTLHLQNSPAIRTGPVNLVIILEESLGAQYVASLGGQPYTPELEKLSSQGLWFENLYSTGTRSIRGIEAVLTGFLPTPGRSVVKLGLAQNNFFTLAQLLGQNGYQSSFIYGGESHFDNMRGFFLGNGFDKIIDENSYPDPVFRGTWGVSDEDLFQRAHEEFTAATEPFFALVFSSSNHSPYQFPAGRIEAEPGEEHKVSNAIRYADYALGKFFEQARQSAYWNNTVFLVVADHDDVVSGAELVPIKHFHIPGLILGGGIEPGSIKTLASQIDLAPTLLSIMGLDVEHPMSGVDLLQQPDSYKGRAIMQYGNTHAYMAEDRVVIHQAHKKARQFRYQQGHLDAEETPDPELEQDALATALWPSIAYRKRLHRLNDKQQPQADLIAVSSSDLAISQKTEP